MSRRLRSAGAAHVAGLALLAYVPFLASSPGRVSADTKQYLYLDPGRLLSRAPYLWDPHVAAGTVPHQNIGYLFPMGPWFWVFDRLGVPDWIAQRLWLGTLTLLAALGARWLLSVLGVPAAGALAGAVVYGFTPYQLAFTARISVLLLPWAALPWFLGWSLRAMRRGGWRDPALFALAALAAGGVNASSLVLVGIGPVLWLVVESCRGRRAARAAAGAAVRIGVLTAGVSVWWAVGLRLQGGYGLPILQATENLRTLAAASSPDDILRGLGNWFFYGRDRLGDSIDQAAAYRNSRLTVAASFAVPLLGLVAAAAVRWRYRVHAVVLVLVGTVVGVGAWPYDDPSPAGALWKAFAARSSIGLALRNTPRIAPIVVLGIAALLAAAVGAVRTRAPRAAAAAATVVVALTGLTPVWRTGWLSDRVDRPEEVPAHWKEAAAALDEEGDATRILEIPGADFAAYRWGNAVEPITPGLVDRPYLAREVLPYGSPASVNLLAAFDRRVQQGTLEPRALAAVARTLAAGTVVVRSDLQYERFGLVRPRLLWDRVQAPLAPGLLPPKRFGSPVRNAPSPTLPLSDALELRAAALPDPPPVAAFDVADAVPIVHTAPARGAVILDGDGDGLVDAAAAGLLDGRSLVLPAASLAGADRDRALAAEAHVVLTDSNRRRVQNWFASIRDTRGATERAGQTATDPNGYDFRIEPFPRATDADRSVVEHRGGLVDATGDGGAPRPEDRAVHAFDGDLRTSWRVGGSDPSGQRLSLRAQREVTADRLTIVQPLDGPRDRVLTRVALRFDGGDPVVVDLGAPSLTAEGQEVAFPRRRFERLDVELLATSDPPFDPGLANAVGFAEVRVADVRVTETVRLPTRLAGALRSFDGPLRPGLDVVLSRLRIDPGETGRQDEELALDRRLELDGARTFTLTGTVRLAANAPDEVIDAAIGTGAAGATFRASTHLQGDASARASRAFDDDPSSAWTPSFGPQEGQWLEAELVAPVTVDAVTLTFVDDDLHSVPRRFRLEGDDGDVRTIALPDRAATGGLPFRAPFEPMTARRLRLVVESVEPRTSHDVGPAPALPIALAAAVFDGVPVPGGAGGDDALDRCRDDLVSIDDEPVGVRIITEGEPGGALALVACAGPVDLDGRSHAFVARAGLDTGLDIDRVVLASGPGGRPAEVTRRGADLSSAGATARVTRSAATAVDVEVASNGEPFWLVLGQSDSRGWQARTSGGALGHRQLVDGYANGWLVTPRSPGRFRVELRWAPQRLVWLGLATSGAVSLVCLAIVVVTGRRRPANGGGAPIPDPPGWMVSWSGRPPVRARTVAVAGIVVTVTAFSRPWIGVAAGGALALASTSARARLVVALGAPVALVLSRVTARPELAWLALALLATDAVALALRSRFGPSGAGHVDRELG